MTCAKVNTSVVVVVVVVVVERERERERGSVSLVRHTCSKVFISCVVFFVMPI